MVLGVTGWKKEVKEAKTEGPTFMLVHIKSEAAQLPRLDRIHGGLRVNEAPSAHVDQDRPRAHGRDAAVCTIQPPSVCIRRECLRIGDSATKLVNPSF